MSEWKDALINEIAEVEMGQSPKGEYCNTISEGLPLLNGPTEFGSMYPKAVQFTTDSKRECKPLDILFCVRGSTTGRMNWADKIYSIGRGIAAIRHKHGTDYRYFLKGIMDHNLQLLLSSATGSTFPNVTRKQIEDLEIKLPSLTEQQSIASILSSLDDKIDLLHRQNKTLEQLAETLFRQWFVEEAEKSWDVGTVNTLVEIQSGFAFKSNDFIENGKYKLITIKNVQDGFLDLSKADMLDEIPGRMPGYCLLKEGDVLLSLTGNVGRCCLVDESALLLNQRVAKLKSRSSRDWALVYIMFRQTSMRRILEELAKGTAQANLSPIETGQIEIQIPPDELLQKFSIQAKLFIEKVLKNKNQIKTLTQLRDTLLPKLMSGVVRVKI